MERLSFIDPFAAEEPPLIAPSMGLPLTLAPPRKPVPTTQVLPAREREVRQLIHDLAVLAAKHATPIK